MKKALHVTVVLFAVIGVVAVGMQVIGLLTANQGDAKSNTSTIEQVEPIEEKPDSLRLIHAEIYESIVMLNISIDKEIDSIRKSNNRYLPLGKVDSFVVKVLESNKEILEINQDFFDPLKYDNTITITLDSTVTKSPSEKIKLRADLQSLKVTVSQSMEAISDNLFMGMLDADARSYTGEPYRRLLGKYNQFHEMYEQRINKVIDSLSN